MNPPIAEHAPEGGRNDQNARPASIRMGGRLQSETAADFAGMRIPDHREIAIGLHCVAKLRRGQRYGGSSGGDRI